MPKRQRKNQKQKDINFSTRTGTKKREKKKFLTDEELNLNIKIRNSSSGSIKEMKIFLENGLSVDRGAMSNTIKEFSNDEVVYEFNKPNIKKQQKSILTLAMVLNFNDLPPDISEIIIGLCKNNIHIEGNIFKVLPHPVIRICNDMSEFEFVHKKELFNVMQKYDGNNTITNFLEEIFHRELREKDWFDIKFNNLNRKKFINHFTQIIYNRYPDWIDLNTF